MEDNNNNNKITFDQLIQNSKKFEEVLEIPTKFTKLENFANNNQDVSQIETFACETRPIIHTKLKVLIEDFLNFKREHGSNVEKQFYKDMDLNAFITRILVKRPFAFLTGSDMALLRNGKRTAGGFETIGTDEEKPPLVLKDYISYDEMQISSMISVSVPTFFINEGGRYNCGKPSQPGSFQRFGVYVALVGARFERDGLMESEYMLISKSGSRKRSKERGFGKGNDSIEAKKHGIWAKFYGVDYFPTFEEAQELVKKGSKDYFEIASFRSVDYFNVKVYCERIRMSVEPFFYEANERAKNANKKAHVRLIGLGLGVWMVTDEQTEWILQVVGKVIQSNDYPFISDIDFTWFPGQFKECLGKRHGDFISDKSGNKIQVHFTKDDPAKLLKEDKLLVCSYAWDGNSLPGNEYWMGSLSASGDPAAASCSLIGTLQNPFINTCLNGNNSVYYGTENSILKL